MTTPNEITLKRRDPCPMCGQSIHAAEAAEKATLIDPPTLEECQWVVDKLTERNPRLFEGNQITVAKLTQVLIGTWIAQRGCKPQLATQAK